MAGATIELQFESTEAEARFLRRYLPDAWNRFENGEYWETGWFWSYRQIADYECGPDGGFVCIVFEGDTDEVIERESDTWDEFAGLSSWELQHYEDQGYDSLLEQQQEVKGEVGGEWEYRMKPLLARFSLAYYREFDSQLPMVGDEHDENPSQIGFWAAVHNTLTQCGYDWYDEIVMCEKALKNRLKSIAAYRGADRAREEYERILADWQAYEETFEAWLDEHPTGSASIP